jgi:PAS domain S-box-containing protein
MAEPTHPQHSQGATTDVGGALPRGPSNSTPVDAAASGKPQHIENAVRASLHVLEQSQATLSESLEQLKIVTDALPVLVSYIDTERRYRFVNAEYERWFGALPMVGRHMSDVLGASAYASVQGRVSRALAGETIHYEGEIPYRAGTRYVDATYVPHVTPDGIAGFVALIADVSARKQVERLTGAVATRSNRLLKITAAIADAVTTEEVFQAVVDRVAEAIGASTAAVWLVESDGVHARLAHALGYPSQARDSLELLNLHEEPSSPAKDSIRRAQPVFLASKQELLELYPHLAPLTSHVAYRIACLPLITRDRVLGTLALTTEEEGETSQEERAFLLLSARYAGQALERLRLYDQERDARAQASAAAERLGVLSHASQVFMNPSFDLDARLRSIVQAIGEVLSSTVGIQLLESDGLFHTRVIHHPIPEAEQWLMEVGRGAPMHPGQAGLTSKVAATGESLLIEMSDPEELRKRAAQPYRDFLGRFPSYGLISAALRAGGKIIGTVTASRIKPNAPYTDDDLRLLEELAERAAAAIENSRLYEGSKLAQARAEQLYVFAQAVAVADKLEAVYDAALGAIETTLHASRCAILLSDDGGSMRFKAWRNLSEAYRTTVDGHSPWSADVKVPEPVLVANVQDDPQLVGLLPVLEAEGIRSLAFIPLLLHGRLLGKFMVYYDTPHSFIPTEVETALTIANHLASVVARFGALDDLKETLRANELFAGVLAHDLRNPLSAIMTAAQFLLMQREGVPGSSTEKKPLGRILSSGQRMTAMIDQLLDFTRARSGGGIGIEPELVNLEDLCVQAVEELELTHPDWTIQRVCSGYLRGFWDPVRLLQVISNLVSNAGNHGDAGTTVTVTLNGTLSDCVSIAVHNRGVISPSIAQCLFDPFRSARQTSTHSRGVGLGLYIVREIVRAHSGSVDVTSTEVSGTTFTVRLPRHAATA